MTLPEVKELFAYWNTSPPEHEFLAMFAKVYTTWEPEAEPRTPEEAARMHMKSLERRWAAGAMNPMQMYKALGGHMPGMEGEHHPTNLKDPAEMPGVGRFPGAP